MDIILIPGFWLDGSSWDEVTPALEQAGHRTHVLTLPGMESADADRSGITLREHVEAVAAAIDSVAPAGQVVLVGHSGGGTIGHGAVDARPEKVARMIYVDSGPVGEGGVINDELPVVGGEIPLPDWSVFEDADLTDLDDDKRAAFRARSIPTPARVASDPIHLTDERRYDVPVTVIACEFPTEMLRTWIAEGHPRVSEIARIRDVEYVDLPTGHWPQFTRPQDLAQAIVASAGPVSPAR
jgi:pimeloyl-ACP methyl ester carboxylesterase